MIKEDDISFLNQAVKMLEDAFKKLEQAYEKKDSEKFNQLKRTIIQTQKGILEAAR